MRACLYCGSGGLNHRCCFEAVEAKEHEHHPPRRQCRCCRLWSRVARKSSLSRCMRDISGSRHYGGSRVGPRSGSGNRPRVRPIETPSPQWPRRRAPLGPIDTQEEFASADACRSTSARPQKLPLDERTTATPYVAGTGECGQLAVFVRCAVPDLCRSQHCAADLSRLLHAIFARPDALLTPSGRASMNTPRLTWGYACKMWRWGESNPLDVFVMWLVKQYRPSSRPVFELLLVTARPCRWPESDALPAP